MHKHSFEEGDWPFDTPINTGVVTTKGIMSGEVPIVEVFHYEDGDWQFMCNTTKDPGDGVLICFGCFYQKFPWIKQFSALKHGHVAFKEYPTSDWEVEKFE